ncbi:MAG: tetratricopeptide repeat protein [Flavobacteriales bacterium]
MKKTIILFAASAITINLNAQLQEAIALTDKEQFEKATGLYKAAVAAAPTSGEAWYFMGENYWYNERRDSAEACYRKGVEVNPRFPLNHIGLGKVLQNKDGTTGTHAQATVGSGGTSASVGMGSNMTEAQRQFEEALVLIEDKTNKFSKPVKSLAYRELAEALVSCKEPNYTTALAHLAKAEELNPTDIEIFILRGDILAKKDPRTGPTEAVAEYKKAIDLQGMNPKPLTKKAVMYHRSGRNPVAAIEEYTKAITNDPAYAPAYRGRAEAYFSNKEVDKATADYEKYLELNKGSVSARVRYAKFLYLVGRYSESLTEINAVKATGLDDNSLRRIEGYNLSASGDYVKALEVMEEYLSQQPDDLEIPSDWEVMGKIYEGLAKQVGEGTITTGGLPTGNLDSLAAEFCLMCVRVDRDRVDLFTNAAQLFRKTKQYDKEVQVWKEKIATGDVKANDWFFLGGAANRAKQFNLADSAWTKYIERNDKAYQGYLGRARANVGLDTAKTTWQAKPFYEEVVRRMKPEEIEKNKVDAEEAYFYLGYYYYSKEENLPMAKCWMEKVRDLNAGTNNTKIGSDMILRKEMKDLAPADCTLLP